MLMEEAERIALQEHGSHKISVISGLYNKVTHLTYFPAWAHITPNILCKVFECFLSV